MNDELIRQIATEIVNENILKNHVFYLMIIGISIVSSFVSAFISAYSSKRGELLATKADFEEIKKQLSESTEISEKIRADISARFQDEIEVKSLLREKLEQIMSETFELELWLEIQRSKAIRKELPSVNESPISKIEMFQAIYFSEVKPEITSLQACYYPMMKYIFSVIRNNDQDKRFSTEEFTVVHGPLLKSLQSLRKALIQKYVPKIGL